MYNANHSNDVGAAHDSHVLLLQIRLMGSALEPLVSKSRALENTSFMQGLLLSSDKQAWVSIVANLPSVTASPVSDMDSKPSLVVLAMVGLFGKTMSSGDFTLH